MLADNIAYTSLQLVLMGFNPCADADLCAKIKDGYGEEYMVLTRVEDETHHVFESQDKDWLYIQQLP